jgi:outer membrane receptor protein involved in Fe transport
VEQSPEATRSELLLFIIDMWNEDFLRSVAYIIEADNVTLAVMFRSYLETFLVVSLLCCLVTTYDSYADQQASSISTPSPSLQPPAATYNLPPVVVTATRTQLAPESSTSYLTVFTQQDVQQTPALVLDDALRQITGFNTFRRSSSIVTSPADDPEAQGVTLRGVGPGGASRALVLLDGVPVSDAFGGWIYWGEIPLNSIDRVEVVEGGGSDLWGNGAEGGVINIITKRPASTGVSIETSYGNHNTTQEAWSADYIYGPIRVSLETNFFNTNGWDIVQDGFQGPLDHSSNSIHELFGGRVEYNVGHGISLFLRGSFYNENRDLGSLFRSASATRGFVNGGASYADNAGDFLNTSVYAHLSTYNQNFSVDNIPRTFETPTQTQTVPSTDVGGFLTWTRTFLRHHQIGSGGDFRLIDGTSKDSYFNPAGTGIVDRKQSSGNQFFVGAYLEDLYRPMENLEFDSSVRGDFFGTLDGKIVNAPSNGPSSTVNFSNRMRTATSPRLGLRYGPWNWFTLRAGLYEAYRAPTLAELYRQSSVESLVLLPNPNLSPEFFDGGELGAQFGKIPGLLLGLTGYWDYLHHPISNVVTATNPITGADLERTRENLGRARIRGYQVDVEYNFFWLNWLRWSAHNPSLSLTANYLRSEATLTSNPPDPTLVGRRLTLVPWNTLNIGLRYSDTLIGDIWFQEQYQGKQYEDSDNHDVQSSYLVTNLTLSRSLPKFSNASWLGASTAYVKIQNLFNQTYIIDLGGGIPKVGTPFTVLAGLSVPLSF